MSKTKLLTTFQEQQRDMWTPEPPDGLSQAALQLFYQAVRKIKFEPLENGGLARDLSQLSLEELFAIGETGDAAWPLSLPSKAKKIQKAMQPRRELGIFPIKKNSDLGDALKRVLDLERETILVTQHGERFSAGRSIGAVSDVTQHIRKLVSEHPASSAKKLYALADKRILGSMSIPVFANKLSQARKAVNTPKPKKKSPKEIIE